MNRKLIKYLCLVVVVVLVLCISLITVLSINKVVFNEIQGGQVTSDGIAVPIIMYHSVMKSSREFGKYVITPTEFENDLKYLKAHYYNTINMTDLINYVYYDGELPAKPVIITFDDGNLNNLLYCGPILEKYQMKAVISVIGKYSEEFSQEVTPTNDPYYSHVTWDQIKAMSASGYFEIQNHTYNMHNLGKTRYGVKRKKGESSEAYKNALTSDIMKLQNKLTELTGVAPNTFTYPYGYMSKEAAEIIKGLGFKATLSCAEGVNLIDKNKENVLYGLKRKNRPHNVSSEAFFANFCP